MNQDAIKAVLGEFKLLKAQGHVVKMDEVFSSKMNLERITITHYLTCPKCEEQRGKS